jgi:tetratricopeptide (TPR) repeat protein
VEALEIYDRVITAHRGVLQEKEFNLVDRDHKVLRRLGVGYYLQFIRYKGDSFLSQIQKMVSSSSGVVAFSKDIKFTRQLTNNMNGESVEVLVPSVQLGSRMSRRVDDEEEGIDGSLDAKKKKFLFSCAIDAYDEVVQGFRQLYGEHAVPLAEVYLSIGDLMFSLEKYEEAKAQYSDTLEMFKKLHGTFLNVGMADALYGIACSMKKLEEATNPPSANGENDTIGVIRQLLEQALQLYQLFYSDDHSKVLSCTSLLATLLTDQMKFERAIGMYEDALSSARKSIAMLNSAVDSEDIEASAADNRVATLAPLLMTLANLYDKIGAYSMAVPLYEEALGIYRDIFDSDDPNCAETMCLLALCYNNDGISAKKRLKNNEGILYAADKYNKAINVLDNALEIYIGANLRESFIYIRALKMQASIHTSSNKYNEARACFDEIFEIYKVISIGSCVELAETQVEYAKLMCIFDDPLEGRVLYQQAIQVYRGIYGEMNENIASIYYAIGDVEYGFDEYENALPFYEDALLIYSQTLGNTSLKFADCHNSIGIVLLKLQVYTEAKEAYREALVIYVMHHGQDHMDVAKVTNNLGTILDDLGEMVSAKFFYDQALQIVGRCKNRQNDLSVDTQSIVALDNFVSLAAEDERNAGIVTGDVEMKEKQIQYIINNMEKQISYMASEIDDSKSKKSNCLIM